MEKVHIPKNSVQETLIIPLFARKLCTEKYPELFQDPKAVELISRLDYDFSVMDKKAEGRVYQFGALEVAMRQTDLSWEIKDYLSLHPKAALVNLGCGLDQTAENCDNGECRIYNIDMPDVISVRNELLPPSGCVTNLAADLNDISWFDSIDNRYGAVFFAAGVFYYFQTSQIRCLFNHMSSHFPGCRLVFDSANRRAVKMMLKTWVKEAGITSIEDYFSIDSLEKDILPWINNADVTARGYMLGYHDLRKDSISGLFKLLSRLGDSFMKMQIVRIDFKNT